MGGYESDDENADKLEQDVVVTTASDASSGDGKVIATSVDGEDDVVDVTMQGSATCQEESDEVEKKELNPRKRKFRSRRPKWVDPDQHLPTGFNDLFELGYFGGNKELVPSGWNVVDEEKKFPKLSSRLPMVQEAFEVDDQNPSGFVPNNATNSDGESSEDDVNDIPQLAPTRMNEESSDEDDSASNTRVGQNLYF